MTPEQTSDNLTRFYELFGARTDVYALGKPKPTDPNKFAYFKATDYDTKALLP